jgi:hypothetical protein
MGAEDAALGGKKLAMASIGFADVRVGAAAGGAAVYKGGLLVVGADAAVPEVGVRPPDVAAAVRVR